MIKKHLELIILQKSKSSKVLTAEINIIPVNLSILKKGKAKRFALIPYKRFSDF
ncbi:XRE family transcriptional regulator [Leuconostoc carnosum JB16]|uniref:XRE family transcriptional regulator n=1 Tax=Leuconostoc carnosum (strain JB16) TaxID=1229758 RepID=K0DA74_LEUCJ|nr:XRE family transcriptional regulator [Leuconostoc carnosum JB16]